MAPSARRSLARMANDGDDQTESTEDLIEGTREAKAAAEESLEKAHEDAAELEQTLEDEGLTPDLPSD